MASEQDHLAQARHNTTLAELLIKDMAYKDWIATTAFYAAVHYVEAMFYRRHKWHTEREKGEANAHQWRSVRLREMSFDGEVPFECWIAYENLRTASNQARYLMRWEEQSGRIASDYFSDIEARAFIGQDLAAIREGFGY